MINSPKNLDGALGTVGIRLDCSSYLFIYFTNTHWKMCSTFLLKYHINYSTNVEMDSLDMFKICPILPSHPANKQMMCRFAIVPAATQITMNWADS